MAIQANPYSVEAIRSRTPIENPLKTADYETNFPLALRIRAQFSAQVENVRLMQRIQKQLEDSISLTKRSSDGVYQTRERFIQEMSDFAKKEGLTPEDPSKIGTLEDITSHRRLKLIYDVQTEQAHEYGRWRMEQDPDVLDAFPAQEFKRVSRRITPRTDWPERWKKAGGKARADGRMIALKNDPVWRKLNRFGVPWPPFDFGSGMGLISLSRTETEALGLLTKNQPVVPAQAGFNEELQASVADLQPQFRESLKTIFGNQVEFKDDMVRWVGANFQPEELAALEDYTAAASQRINATMRDGGELPPELKIRADNAVAALDRLPPVPVEAFRQIVADPVEIIKRYQPGNIVVEKAFTSASKTLTSTLPGNVRFIYRPNPNGHGRDISLYSHLPLEEEVLYKPGSKFRVLSVEQKEGELIIQLEEIG